jgi:hypothetical protein
LVLNKEFACQFLWYADSYRSHVLCEKSIVFVVYVQVMNLNSDDVVGPYLAIARIN